MATMRLGPLDMPILTVGSKPLSGLHDCAQDQGGRAAVQQRVGVPLVALISRHTPGMGLSRQLDAYTSPECSLKDGGSQAHLQQHGTTNHTRSPEEPIRPG